MLQRSGEGSVLAGLDSRIRPRSLAGRFVLLGWIGMSLLGALPAAAQGPGEYQVKAAFLYNFVKFVEWPAGNPDGIPAPLTLCVIGDDPFDNALDAVVRGKSFNGREFQVRHVANVQAARSCSVLFISTSERARVPQILEGLKGTSVLTIGDTPGYAKQGCVIGFLIEDNKVRFEINAAAASLANLKISSKLLSLAKIVWE
jgi:hypothetical protein